MLTPAKIALATALIAITGSVALAQEFDPNLANRYPAYADPTGSPAVIRSAAARLRTRDVARPAPTHLRTRAVALPTVQSAGQSSR